MRQQRLTLPMRGRDLRLCGTPVTPSCPPLPTTQSPPPESPNAQFEIRVRNFRTPQGAAGPREQSLPCGGARAAAVPNRNGGRHCCQPPLRRAKDMPVFGLPGPAPRKVWHPASRSWLTSSGVAFHRTALSEEKPDFYSTALPEGSLVFRCPARLKTEVFAQNRSMFRGPSWGNCSCVPLCSPWFRKTLGAASR